jgi:hypothetical protein
VEVEVEMEAVHLEDQILRTASEALDLALMGGAAAE